jgi:hypothetical protein
MKSRVLAFCLGISTILAVSQRILAQDSAEKASSKIRCRVTKEEVEVYADFLRSQQEPTHLTAIVTHTDARDYDIDSFNWQLAARGHGIPPEIRDDFRNKNRVYCTVEPFSGIPNLKFISRSEENKSWSEFHKMYGKGSNIVTVSRVGFSQNKNLALLEVLWAGQGGAAGFLYMLERKDKVWVVKWYIQTAAT